VVRNYRAAIQLAEAQSEQTGQSALSAPGIPLPELPPPAPPRAAVEQLVLSGEGAGEVAPGGPVAVSAEVTIREGVERAELVISVLRSGQVLSEARAPAPGPGRSHVRWTLEALPLLPGRYGLRVSVVAGGETLAAEELKGGWSVTGAPAASVVALSGRWSVEPAAGARAS
jgi:hypothetical protein